MNETERTKRTRDVPLAFLRLKEEASAKLVRAAAHIVNEMMCRYIQDFCMCTIKALSYNIIYPGVVAVVAHQQEPFF